MADERRYRDDEVRRIFEGATRQSDRPLPARTDTEGLTLAQLQEIGREVGLQPSTVAAAVAGLDAHALAPPPRTSLGMPVGVSRVVPLPRAPTDLEWERLVAELRTTFGARGKVSSEGGLREWSNGNLHACIEPADAGYRLRLGTHKGDADSTTALGAVGVVAGAFTYAALTMSGAPPEAVIASWAIAGSGVGTVLLNWRRLTRWSRTREAQMLHLAARVEAIMDAE